MIREVEYSRGKRFQKEKAIRKIHGEDVIWIE